MKINKDNCTHKFMSVMWLTAGYCVKLWLHHQDQIASEPNEKNKTKMYEKRYGWLMQITPTTGSEK